MKYTTLLLADALGAVLLAALGLLAWILL